MTGLTFAVVPKAPPTVPVDEALLVWTIGTATDFVVVAREIATVCVCDLSDLPRADQSDEVEGKESAYVAVLCNTINASSARSECRRFNFDSTPFCDSRSFEMVSRRPCVPLSAARTWFSNRSTASCTSSRSKLKEGWKMLKRGIEVSVRCRKGT